MKNRELSTIQKRKKKDTVLLIIALILIFSLIILSTYMYLTTHDFSKKTVKDKSTTTTETTTINSTVVTNTTTNTVSLNTKVINTTKEEKKTVSYSFPDDVNNTSSTYDNSPIYKYSYELIGDVYKIVLFNTNKVESKIYNISLIIDGNIYKDLDGVITVNKAMIDLSNKPTLVFEVKNTKITVQAKED